MFVAGDFRVTAREAHWVWHSPGGSLSVPGHQRETRTLAGRPAPTPWCRFLTLDLISGMKGGSQEERKCAPAFSGWLSWPRGRAKRFLHKASVNPTIIPQSGPYYTDVLDGHMDTQCASWSQRACPRQRWDLNAVCLTRCYGIPLTFLLMSQNEQTSKQKLCEEGKMLRDKTWVNVGKPINFRHEVQSLTYDGSVYDFWTLRWYESNRQSIDTGLQILNWIFSRGSGMWNDPLAMLGSEPQLCQPRNHWGQQAKHV